MLGGSANTTVYIIPICGGKAGDKYVACVCTGIAGGGGGWSSITGDNISGGCGAKQFKVW